MANLACGQLKPLFNLTGVTEPKNAGTLGTICLCNSLNYVAQAGLNCAILLRPPSKGRDYRCMPQFLGAGLTSQFFI